MIYCGALLGLALVAFAPRSLLSQSRHDTVAVGQSALQTQLNKIKLSSRLRLQTAGNRLEGRLIFRTADSLGVRGVRGNETRLPVAGIDRLWVRRHQTRLGFLIGTLVGGAAYLVITRSESAEDLEYPEFDNAMGGVFWVGSALVGTIVGAMTSHWKRVHPN